MRRSLDTDFFVKFSLALETALFLLKLAALIVVTGAALFSETLHSMTDIMNSVFLYTGIRLSKRKPDPEHPFGYGMETFFWAFLTAVFMITVSATFSITRGVEQLIDPEPLHSVDFGLWSMAAGTIVSVVTLVMGARIVFYGRPISVESFRAFVDPTVKVKIAEDIAAVAGNMLALGAIVMFALTGSVFFDAVAGIAVGLLLGSLGFMMALESKDLIIGRSASRRQRWLILRAAMSVRQVVRVMELKTMMMGPDEILVNIEVNLAKGLDTGTVEMVMDEVREAIIHAVPEARHIQVEVESL